MGRTSIALIRRGVDAETARKIEDLGQTLSSIKTSKIEEIKLIGLNEDTINAIQNEERPPIPNKTAKTLLFNNRHQCCICRDSSKSIIIHHIKE